MPFGTPALEGEPVVKPHESGALAQPVQEGEEVEPSGFGIVVPSPPTTAEVETPAETKSAQKEGDGGAT